MADDSNLVRQHLSEFRRSGEFSSLDWPDTYDAVCVFGEFIVVNQCVALMLSYIWMIEWLMDWGSPYIDTIEYCG